MKVVFLTLISVMLFTSCSTIEDNSPALQGIKDSLLFRANDSRAIFNIDGSLVVTGERGLEAVNLLVNNQSQSPVTLGGSNNTNIAVYTDENGVEYSTLNPLSRGNFVYSLNGDTSLSGEFSFTAYTESLQDSVFFYRGIAYQVPILSPLMEEPEVIVLSDSFTAKVNTITFVPTIINSSVSGNLISVVGLTSTTSLAINFPLNTMPGDYLLGTNPDLTAGYTVPAGFSGATSGQLTIISNDPANEIIVGTFSFQTDDGFDVTEGAFTINY